MERTNNDLTVVGLFRDNTSAECAYDALSGYGYDTDSSDVLMSDQTRDRYYSGSADSALGSKAAEGTGAGAAIGGTIGAVLAAIAAIGTSVVLPGIGLVVAGPLAAALVGAGAGGLAGGLVGALVGSGIPEDHAAVYEEGIKSGGIVLRAYPRNAEDAANIESKWRSCGGEQIYTNATSTTTTTTTTRETAPAPAVQNEATLRSDAHRNEGEVTIPVIEEDLHVGKRTVETGGVNVRTNVTERPVEETVHLREENVVVDRRPVDRAVTDADVNAVRDADFTVTERAEQAVVDKQARVVEEVVVGKEVVEHDETVRDTVRRTDVDVEDLTDRDRDDVRNRNV